MSTPLDDVQRIVLCGSRWQEARHLVLGFGASRAPLHFLHQLEAHCWPARAGDAKPEVQASLGFSRRGLEHAQVPRHVLAQFALKSPAFYAGAALRAHRYLGVSGRNGPGAWQPAFGFTTLDAVLSLHGMDGSLLDQRVACIRTLANACDVQVQELLPASRLQPPPGETADPLATWVHFGYRDGLSQVGIQGWQPPERLTAAKPISPYAAGEFVLGHPQGSGSNPWIAGPGTRVWPEQLRSFFHNGSFGVLNQVEQDAEAFEQFVGAKPLELGPRELKGKLCGRYTDGYPLGATQDAPDNDFDYAKDEEGYGCPFGAHARRMNPRGGALPDATRPRPLLRRGMPYGAPLWGEGSPSAEKRGLIGQFFCASIEDQFEHLVGQWADRVPLGSADRGGARDPLVGAHEPGDGAFEIPQGAGKPPLLLEGLRPFTRTAGVAYLFYPSLQVLEKIVQAQFWRVPAEDAR